MKHKDTPLVTSGINPPSYAANSGDSVAPPVAPKTKSSSSPLSVGDVLKGRFEIIEVLGQGGMGMVYKALDMRRQEAKSRNPYLAIKVLTPALAKNATLIAGLQRECEKAQLLSHPNIITVYDFDRDGDYVFMSMEYLVGLPLGKIIGEEGASRGIKLERAWPIIRKMGEALAYAHRKNIVHNDFKPANVFLTGNDEVKILDFGIASRLEQTETNETIFDARAEGGLTPVYASFEMLNGSRADPRDDIYAFGLVVYELLTGHHPYARKPASKVFLEQRRGQQTPVKSPHELNRKQWQLLKSAIEILQEQRPLRLDEWLEQFDPKKQSKGLDLILAGLGVLLTGVGVSFWILKESFTPLKTHLTSNDALLKTLLIIIVCIWIGIIIKSVVRMIRRNSLKANLKISGLSSENRKSPADASREPVNDSGLTILEPVIQDSKKASHPVPDFFNNDLDNNDATCIVHQSLELVGSDFQPFFYLVFTRCVDKKLVGKRVSINEFPFIVGRGADVDLIVADSGLSRRSLSLENRTEQLVARDLGSTNGFYVNGRKISPGGESPIFFGDELRLTYNTSLTIVIDDARQLPDLCGQTIENCYRLLSLKHLSVKAALYVAEDLSLPRTVAIKILSPHLANYTGYLEQFHREAEIAARLQYPNICRILAYGTSLAALNDDKPSPVTYLCMEYMEGGSLAERIENAEPIPLSKIACWIRDLGNAFDYIHNQGVIHSSIKPSAIVFDQKDNPYLTDFAIANRLGDANNNTVFGSPAFLAPEQWENRELSPATDEYAFASVLYQLITGVRPFEGQDDPDVRARNFLRGPSPAHEEALRQGRKGVQSAVSPVLARALSTQAVDRYASVGEFVKALNQALAGKISDMPKIFLSYNRDASAGWAALIAQNLKEHYGISAFVDTQRIDAVGRFPARLQRAIESCDIFVCLLAHQTLDSEWVRREIRIAYEAKRPMLPIFQESFDAAALSDSQDDSINELLNFDGLHLLDRRHIHIDYTISELARVVKCTLNDRYPHTARGNDN